MSESKQVTMTVSDRERNSILAGLRLLQEKVEDGSLPLHGSDRMPHFDDVSVLSSEEIDALNERISLLPSTDSIIEQIKNDSTVNQTIREALSAGDNSPWGVIEIHENVFDALGIDLNIEDTDLFGSLLAYYNSDEHKKFLE